MDSAIYYMGRNIEELEKAELVEAIKEFVRSNRTNYNIVPVRGAKLVIAGLFPQSVGLTVDDLPGVVFELRGRCREANASGAGAILRAGAVYDVYMVEKVDDHS